ncbi:hypothetical protein KKC13_06785 [bacterium]|nr:hypothetical protein [bacterium]MBU1958615.1 hypothetical protein [bacterium]
MKILLINNNPVVSRLTALSARKEEIEIDEIQEVTELSNDHYDIVFVDADSLSKDVRDVISENIKVQKKVLFYAQDDKEDNESFDMTILKPFLPSEVSAVIRSVEESESDERELDKNYDLFANKEEAKREALFDLDEDITDLSKFENKEIKEDLSSEEESFDKKLKEAFPLKDIELDEDLFDEPKVEDEDLSLKNKDDLFELELNDDKLTLDEDLFTEDDKKSKVPSDNELLDFDFENNDELDFSSEKVDLLADDLLFNNESKNEQKEQMNNKSDKEVTKILDAAEIANIKDILEDDTSDTMELSDLMSTATPTMVNLESTEEKVEKKKKSKKVKEHSKLNSDVSLETLANLPVESLRKLLAGARVNISIKFPKD